jgi:hypothetical protein
MADIDLVPPRSSAVKRQPLTGAQRAKRGRSRKAGGMVHVAFDPGEEVLKAVLIAAGILTETEAEDRRNFAQACDVLIVKLGNRLSTLPEFLRHGVTLAGSTIAEQGPKSATSGQEFRNV